MQFAEISHGAVMGNCVPAGGQRAVRGRLSGHLLRDLEEGCRFASYRVLKTFQKTDWKTEKCGGEGG